MRSYNAVSRVSSTESVLKLVVAGTPSYMQVVDDEAARGEDHALGVLGIGVDAWSVVEHVAQRLEFLVVDCAREMTVTD